MISTQSQVSPKSSPRRREQTKARFIASFSRSSSHSSMAWNSVSAVQISRFFMLHLGNGSIYAGVLFHQVPLNRLSKAISQDFVDFTDSVRRDVLGLILLIFFPLNHRRHRFHFQKLLVARITGSWCGTCSPHPMCTATPPSPTASPVCSNPDTARKRNTTSCWAGRSIGGEGGI